MKLRFDDSVEAFRRAVPSEGSHVIVAVVRDVAERRAAEEELRRFRLAMDNSADIIVLIDRATMRFVDVNETACRLLGYTREEMLEMGPQDVLPVSRAELERSYDELIARPRGEAGVKSSGMISHYSCKDGALLQFESSWDRKHIVAADQFLPILDRIAKNESYLHEARLRAATMADTIRAAH